MVLHGSHQYTPLYPQPMLACINLPAPAGSGKWEMDSGFGLHFGCFSQPCQGLLKDSNLKITCLDADEATDVAQAVEAGLAALDTHQEEERNEPWSILTIWIYMVDGHPIHNKDPKIMVIINPE